MKKPLGIILLAFCFVGCTPNQTYFDINWKETTKAKASYYRPAPKKENHIWHINDYYISGETQFIGQAKDSLATILEGDATWYFQTGKVQSKIRYEEGEIIGQFMAVEGSIGSDEEGWNEKDLYYYPLLAKAADAQNAIADAQSQRTDVYEYYYAKTSTVAGQHTDNVGYEDKFSFALFFDTEGDTIGRLDYNETSDKWKGKEIVFHQIGREHKNEVGSIKEINIYRKGLIEHTEYYNTNEEKIADGSFKNGEPFVGTFFSEACWFKKIQYYEKGSLWKEITFDHNDEEIGAINFKNKMPDTGIFCNCATVDNYKNGKLDGTSIQYLYGGIGEELEEKHNFNYKNGIKHGDYVIHDNEGTLLEKGSYENGVQTGEVWYYRGGGYIDESDRENTYYLKTKIQTVNNKPFISEFSQFDLEDNELLQTFELEQNSTDKFTYLGNGYHAIYLDDLNSDGFDDLKIWYSHHTENINSSTCYLFNSATNKYQHIPGLDNTYDIDINPSEKTIAVSISERFEDQTSYITYGFLNDKLIKKTEVEEVHHRERDTTFMTQIFPVPINDFPLLDPNLPPITFVQQNEQQQITNTHQTVELKKEPLTIVLPGLINTTFPNDFNVKITASYNKNVFEKATINQREEDTSIFGSITAFARGSNQLIIAADGHNLFYYDKTPDATLDYIKNINENVSLLQFDIDKVHDGGKENVISEISKPIYMMIYIDKNANKKIDENEIFYVTIHM